MGADLIVKALMVLAVLATVAGGVEYLRHQGAAEEHAKNELANAKERAARAVEISGLNQDLSDATKEREESRATAERKLAQTRAEFKGRLNEFVPKVAGSDTCLRAGWVRYVDAAAAGMPLGPRPGPGAAEAPSGVATDEAAGVIAENYLACRAYKQRVDDITGNFDGIRSKVNTVVDRINQRLKRAEGRVQ